MNICKTIETMAQDLREIKNNTARSAVKEVFKEHLSPLGWVSIAKHGLPRFHQASEGYSIDVLAGTVITVASDARVAVVGWGYYSHISDAWYVASSPNFPHLYMPTREKITHYLEVPKYAKE